MEDSVEKRYLDACIAAQQARDAAEREEQERRVRDAERIAEEQKKAAAAQKKTAQRTRIAAGFFLVFMVIAIASAWFAVQKGNEAQRRLAELYEEQGRQELLKGNHEPALAYLNEAYAQGADSVSLRYLIAQAVRSLGVPRVSLEDERGPIREAAFSPDNRLVITVGEKGTAKAWDAKTGAVVFSEGSDGAEAVGAATLSPDGTRILTVSRNGKAKLRRIDDPVAQVVFGNPDGGVRAAHFSPSGTRVLTEGPGARLEVWDPDGGKQVVSLHGHTADIESAFFSADGSTIVAAAGARSGYGMRSSAHRYSPSLVRATPSSPSG